jgi:hypothetical protein
MEFRVFPSILQLWTWDQEEAWEKWEVISGAAGPMTTISCTIITGSRRQKAPGGV